MEETKILVVGPAWIGDMVMAQCLFRLLKQRRSGCTLHVLAPPVMEPLLARMPEVDRALVLPFKHGEWGWFKRRHIGRALRASGYQQAIVLPNSWKSALIPFWARIPHRTGWRGEMRFGLLNDIRRLDPQAMPQMIQRFIALGLEENESMSREPLLPCLEPNVEARQAALIHYELNQKREILVLCPGAAFGPAKRWPVEYFAEVAKEKVAEGWQVWMFGGPAETASGDHICQAVGEHCINLAGKTTLAEAIDLLSLASMVVSNDSGLMHISAALARPLVAIYGSSSSVFTPPLSKAVSMLSLNLECSPCFRRECPLGHLRCLRELKPDLVLQAIDGLETAS